MIKKTIYIVIILYIGLTPESNFLLINSLSFSKQEIVFFFVFLCYLRNEVYNIVNQVYNITNQYITYNHFHAFTTFMNEKA